MGRHAVGAVAPSAGRTPGGADRCGSPGERRRVRTYFKRQPKAERAAEIMRDALRGGDWHPVAPMRVDARAAGGPAASEQAGSDSADTPRKIRPRQDERRLH